MHRLGSIIFAAFAAGVVGFFFARHCNDRNTARQSQNIMKCNLASFFAVAEKCIDGVLSKLNEPKKKKIHTQTHVIHSLKTHTSFLVEVIKHNFNKK